MSITDELRDWASNHYSGWPSKQAEGFAIADRIDAAFEENLFGERNIAYNAGFDAGYASADDWFAQHEDAMAEHGWVKLPVGADGEPIRFGDKVTVPWNKKVYEVRGFSYTQQLAGGKRTVWVDVYSLEKPGNVPLCAASSCHHYKPPTVEDVLTEFGIDWEHESDCEDRAALLAEYAAKLREMLAGDAE